ncbi:MAG: tetratricopeptide repeat protein, partial [Pirellulaceae bacterium]
MIYAIRIVVIVIVLEVVVGAALLGWRAWRLVPQVPDVELNDPLIMPQLRDLARAAEFGTSDDWRLLGEGLLGKGFYAHAEQAFRESLRLDPHNFHAQFGLAFSLDRTGRMRESTLEYRKVSQLRARSPDQEMLKYHALYALGRNALRLENLVEAEEWFRQNPGFPPAEYQLAKLLIRSGRVDQALPIIERNLAEIPYSLEFHLLDHRANLARNRPRAAFEAEARMERSATLVSMNFNTDYVGPLMMRTGIRPLLQELGEVSTGDDLDRIEQRCVEIKTLLGDAPVFTARHVDDLLVDVALRKKQPELVLDRIAVIRKGGREDALLLESEGDARQMLGQSEKGALAWNRALTLTPSIPLHQKLARYYAEEESDLRDLHLGRAALLRGIERYRDNRLEEAIAPFLEATEKNPADPDPWFYLGEMHFHLGRPEQAAAAYRECLERKPGHGRAAAKLAHIEG